VTLEVVVDDRLVDIVREGFDAVIRLGESVARDGAGLAMVSEADAQADLAAGRLLRVLEGWCPPEFGFLLYHPRSRQPSASLRALIGALAVPPQAGSP
jgi:DNA-binding transcriptional LysR family regulator